MKELSLKAAINQALHEEMSRDERVVAFGEDVGLLGGNFGVTAGLMERFGELRCFDTPISENGIAGIALGMAMTGLRPVAEIMFCDFALLASDQILNQIAKIRYMSGGQVKIPLVIRMTVGGRRGSAAQHSQSLHALFVHVPGVKVVMPSNPADAKGLLKAAIRDDNPVVFLEHKMQYNQKGPVPDDRDFTVQLGTSRIHHPGRDLTVLGTGLLFHDAEEVVHFLEKDGHSIELIDIRSFRPFDKETILNSVRKTNRVLIIDEGHQSCGIAAELAAIISHAAFEHLDAPVERVCTKDFPIPYSQPLENAVIPTKDEIRRRILEMLK